MEKIKCKYCEKVMEGYSKKQVNYMLNQHILAKHPDKIGKVVVHKNSCGNEIRDSKGKVAIYCGDDLGGNNGEFAQCIECIKKDLEESK